MCICQDGIDLVCGDCGRTEQRVSAAALTQRGVTNVAQGLQAIQASKPIRILNGEIGQKLHLMQVYVRLGNRGYLLYIWRGKVPGIIGLRDRNAPIGINGRWRCRITTRCRSWNSWRWRCRVATRWLNGHNNNNMANAIWV